LPVATEEQLEALDLRRSYVRTYKVYHSQDPPLAKEKVAEILGVKPSTVKTRLARVEQKLKNPNALRSPNTGSPHLSRKDPKTYAKAVVELTDPQRNLAEIGRKLGLGPDAVRQVAKECETYLQPLTREIRDVRLEEIVRRFGTLTEDAIDAITPEKLQDAGARDLAVIAGIGATNWQLLRGQPTSRMEINDRREMNEVLQLMVAEAKRRGLEIDVTPEGVTSVAKKKDYHSVPHKRLVKEIEASP
jgi:hypothetical protein